MRTSFPVVVFLVLATAMPVLAQPSGDALLESWRRGWQAASADVRGMQFTEEAQRTLEGPREAQHLTTLFDVTLGVDQRPERDFRRAWLNDRPILQARLTLLERRLQRAYGPGYRWLRQPVFFTERLLRLLEPAGRPTPDRLGSQPAWRLETSMRSPNDRIERVTLWFARSGPRERTRLLRARMVGRMPERGSALSTTDYVSVQGLDLPGRTQVEVVLPQRRRQRVFTILMAATLRYTDYTVVPR